MNVGVIVAAGRSERMGKDVDKAFLNLGPRPVLVHSLLAFEACADIQGIVLVVRKEKVEGSRALAQTFGITKLLAVVAGGALRQDSVRNGVEAAGDDASIIAVHDGARPFVTPALISETIRSTERQGSGVAATKSTDTIKWVEKGMLVSRTLDRSKLWSVQTPQTFRLDWLVKALEHVKRKELTVTDEAGAVEALGKPVHLVASSVFNIKITTTEDLAMAAALLERRQPHSS